ncbi:MAG: Prolyl 4-hydroxylase alpha subunit [Flavipsychrobacter sp.]|nr:Prolyl 4-hydroxylase alpha subunit [Flavipsychrobacter sp.]
MRYVSLPSLGNCLVISYIKPTFTEVAICLVVFIPSSLQESFNVLVDSFIDNKVGIADDFLSEALAGHLKQNLAALYENKQLLQAGTGNKAAASMDLLVRGDRIYWLDRAHNDPFENAFLDLVDEFVAHLNASCYAGVTGYEFHYTLYETGRFYKKHIDQFRTDESRKYSMIIYLNADWQEGDGGELCIHHSDSFQSIAPVNRKSVFFLSGELEHEVLVTHEPRMSITGWLKVGGNL